MQYIWDKVIELCFSIHSPNYKCKLQEKYFVSKTCKESFKSSWWDMCWLEPPCAPEQLSTQCEEVVGGAYMHFSSYKNTQAKTLKRVYNSNL